MAATNLNCHRVCLVPELNNEVLALARRASTVPPPLAGVNKDHNRAVRFNVT